MTPERRLMVLDPWQKNVIKQLFERDPATGARRYTMAIISATKKSGKTSLAASLVLWHLIHGPDEGEILLAATAEHQSKLVIFKKLHKAILMNKYLNRPNVIKLESGAIENLKTGTTVRVVPVTLGVAGLNPSLVVCDEMHAWKEIDSNLYRDFFDELTVSPSRDDGLCLITSYAGTREEGLFWELYQKGIEGKDPRLLFFWSHDPFLSPRIRPEKIEDKRNKMHPNSFARMFENRWTHGEAEFVRAQDYDKCVDPNHVPMFEDPGRGLHVFLGIDIGVKSDCSAVVAVAKQGDKVALIQHRKWKPEPNDPVDIRDIEDYILDLSKKFNIEEAHFDPSQFLEGSRRLSDAGVNMVQFTQSQNPLIVMAQNLYQLIKSTTLKLYQAEDLRAHVLNANIKESAKGFQIVKGTASKKVDLAISLAMACQACVKQPVRAGGMFALGDVMPVDDYGSGFVSSGEKKPLPPNCVVM
ncbi:MAG: terminase large subunit domain-containing protein [Candidatus Velamenicoccus archaeovorus]